MVLGTGSTPSSSLCHCISELAQSALPWRKLFTTLRCYLQVAPTKRGWPFLLCLSLNQYVYFMAIFRSSLGVAKQSLVWPRIQATRRRKRKQGMKQQTKGKTRCATLFWK
jgi:hypothetical protein